METSNSIPTTSIFRCEIALSFREGKCQPSGKMLCASQMLQAYAPKKTKKDLNPSAPNTFSDLFRRCLDPKNLPKIHEIRRVQRSTRGEKSPQRSTDGLSPSADQGAF